MRELWRRIEAWLRRRSLDRDLDEELRFHLDMKTGHGRRAAAQRALGNPFFCASAHADAWGWRWLDDGLWDIRYALRQFRQNPASRRRRHDAGRGYRRQRRGLHLDERDAVQGTPHWTRQSHPVHQYSRASPITISGLAGAGTSFMDNGGRLHWREKGAPERPTGSSGNVRRDPTECQRFSGA